MHTYKVTFSDNSKLFMNLSTFTEAVHDAEYYMLCKAVEDSEQLSIVSIVRV